MGARQKMTQRALVERGTPGATDDNNNPGAPVWATHLAAMPCLLYGSVEKEAVTTERTAVVADLKLMAPLGVDLTERDRINGIKDRLGTVIESGLLDIDSVLRKRDHLELALTKVAS